MIHLSVPLVHGLVSAATTTAAVSSGSILDPIAKPIAWVLAGIYAVVPNFGVAILVLSVIWMVLISPLTLKSTRSMLAMQKLQPEIKKLQEKHKNDKQAFAQAQMELFREHQVSPFGSCLPMLLPMPVFFALFRVIDGLSHTVRVSGVVQYRPQYLSPSTQMYKAIVASHGRLDAFGMNLANNAFSHHSSFFAALPFWLTLAIMGGTSYFQSSMMMSRNPANANNPQMRMMKFIPLVFVLFCIRFPAGVILYYAMSNVCRIVQQDAMYRYDPRVKALVVQEVQEVEALTHEIDEAAGRTRRPGSTPSPSSPKPAASKARFRDYLAAAADQQQKAKSPPSSSREASQAKRPQPKGAISGPGGGSNGKRNSAGGVGSANGSANGSARSKGRPQQAGHRTNRKRRGRR
jgi:YidC/Oxa1 family membrane protein insertase